MKILKFYTETCMTCKVIGKVLDRLGVEVQNVNAIDETALVDDYNVCATPTLIFLNEDGKEVDRTTGPVTESRIREILNKG